MTRPCNQCGAPTRGDVYLPPERPRTPALDRLLADLAALNIADHDMQSLGETINDLRRRAKRLRAKRA